MRHLATALAAAVAISLFSFTPGAAHGQVGDYGLPYVDTGTLHCPDHEAFQDLKTTKGLGYVPPTNALVCIKAGSPESNPSGVGNTGWFPALAGVPIRHYMRHSGLVNQDNKVRQVSYIIVRPLVVDPPARKAVNPKARIHGPKGDPWYRVVLDNRDSERSVTFRVSPFGIKKTVPGGCVWRSGWRYIEGGKVIKVRRGNGTLLARKRTVWGYYGPLYYGFQRGLHC